MQADRVFLVITVLELLIAISFFWIAKDTHNTEAYIASGVVFAFFLTLVGTFYVTKRAN